MKASHPALQRPADHGSAARAEAQQAGETLAPESMIEPASDRTIPAPPPSGCEGSKRFDAVSPRAETLPAPPSDAPRSERETMPAAEPAPDTTRDGVPCAADFDVHIAPLRPIRSLFGANGIEDR